MGGLSFVLKLIIMNHNHNQCPACGAEEFISEPCHYDLYEFHNGEFNLVGIEYADTNVIYCRECSAPVDLDLSEQENRIVLKTATTEQE